MAEQGELFGKTFDQQLELTEGDILGKDISPNRRVPGEVVFEPVLNGVRVTARDEEHHLLWGFIGSKDMLKQIHCPVAVYETLQDLLCEELDKSGLPSKDENDLVEEAKNAIKNLQDILKKLQKSVTVVKVSDATKDRAKTISRVVNDASRLIYLETKSFINLKKKDDDESKE